MRSVTKKTVSKPKAGLAPLPKPRTLKVSALVERKTRGDMTHAFTRDIAQNIREMRKGVPANIIPIVARRLDMTQDALFDYLKLPRSTIKGRIKKNESLSAVEQDRFYRIERVLSRALMVLEDENAAREWLRRQNRSLGGEAPIELLDTEAGFELVIDTLGRIEYGIPA